MAWSWIAGMAGRGFRIDWRTVPEMVWRALVFIIAIGILSAELAVDAIADAVVAGLVFVPLAVESGCLTLSQSHEMVLLHQTEQHLFNS